MRAGLPRGGAALLALVVTALLVAAPADARSRVALGAFVPDVDRSPAKIESFARKAGRRPLIVHTYKDWGNRPFEPRELRGVWRRGAVPLITWEPWGFPLRKIARGRYDRYVRASARAAARWGRPLFLRFAHEMNGDWYPWGEGTGARTYKRAWRHLVRVFRRAGARNVRWVWTPYVNPGWNMPFKSRYPGRRWVDWVGLDGINWGGSSPWRSFKQLFGPSYRALRRISSAPVMLAEVGSGERGGSKSRWISRALHRDVPRMAGVKAFLWWSKSDPRGDIRIDSSRGSLRALRRASSRRIYRTRRRAIPQVRFGSTGLRWLSGPSGRGER